MPVYPFIYEHREYAITDTQHHADCAADCDLDHVTADDIHTFDDGPSDNDQPVTVADLLDAANTQPFTVEHSHHLNLLARADEDTLNSFSRTRHTIATRRHLDNCLARLSPEERAEYDRRTT